MELTFVCRPTHAWFLCKPAWWFSASSSWLPSSGFSPSHASTPGSMTARRKSSSASQLQILGEKNTLISQKKVTSGWKVYFPSFPKLDLAAALPSCPSLSTRVAKDKIQSATDQVIKESKNNLLANAFYDDQHLSFLQESGRTDCSSDQKSKTLLGKKVELNKNFHQAK